MRASVLRVLGEISLVNIPDGGIVGEHVRYGMDVGGGSSALGAVRRAALVFVACVPNLVLLFAVKGE